MSVSDSGLASKPVRDREGSPAERAREIPLVIREQLLGGQTPIHVSADPEDADTDDAGGAKIGTRRA